MPRKRCPNGTRKNKATGKCESKKTVTRKSPPKRSSPKKSTNFRKKSYVMIHGVGTLANVRHRVGQVIDISRDEKQYAVRVNYNGFLTYVKKSNLRPATDAEKKSDKKSHNKSDNLTGPERLVLNNPIKY